MLSGMASMISIRAKKGGAADVTPNAVNWTTPANAVTATTEMLQITGISQSITLRLSWTLSGSSNSTFAYSLNSTATYSQTATLVTSPVDITVSNNQYLGFRLIFNGSIGTTTRNLTVTNVSDGNATLDTVSITASNSGGGGG